MVVTVIQGKNLPIMDKNLFSGLVIASLSIFCIYYFICFVFCDMFSGGSSDPLVRMEIDGYVEKKTKHLTKNLNPIWWVVL